MVVHRTLFSLSIAVKDILNQLVLLFLFVRIYIYIFR